MSRKIRTSRPISRVTVEEIIAAIRKLPDKSCALDVLPTPQLKHVADLIAPFLC